MKLVLAVAVLALAAVSAQAKCQKDYAEYYGNAGGETVCKDCGVDPDCPWYDEESCCNKTKAEWEAIEKANKDDPTTDRCADKPEGCQEVGNLFGCLACSPNTKDFIEFKDGKSTITVCKSFADRYYAACQDAEVDLNEFKTDKKGKDDGDCVKISEEYKDGTELFEKKPGPDSLTIEVAEDDKDCFNSASGLAASAVVVLGALATLF